VLKTKLLPAEKAGIEKRPTENLTAYDYYFKGREYYYRYNEQDNETAIGLFKKAIDLDTNYALALAGLADAYAQRYGLTRVNLQWIDSSIAISTKAIARDGNSAEAYKALGLAYQFKGFYRKALDANRKALQLNPNYDSAIDNVGDILAYMGDLIEGMKWNKKALRLNPTLALYYASIAGIYGRFTDDIKADKYFKRALELQPDLPLTYRAMFIWHIQMGQFQQAANDIERRFSLDHDTVAHDDRVYTLSLISGNIDRAKEIAEKYAARGDSNHLPYIYWKEGKKEKARKMFNDRIAKGRKEIKEGSENPDISYTISSLYAIQEEKAEALRWLRKAIDAGWRRYREAMTDPYMISIRNDEKFKLMIAEVKANVEKQKIRVQEMEKAEEQ
jgi:tetratricopeptide (TPR) repeat protein